MPIHENKRGTLPEKNEWVFTPYSFGIKRISKETVIKNIDVLKYIAKQAKEFNANTEKKV